MGRPGRARATKKVAGTAQSPTPLEPRIDGALTSVGGDEIDQLLDEPQWSRLHVTADLVGHSMERIEIAECRLTGSRLGQLDLHGGRILDTTFQDCDLSGTSLNDAALTRVTFVNCRLSGLILNGARLRDVRITDCKADQISLRMATTERLTCERVLMAAADFYQASLTLTRLFDCDLTGAEFSNVVLDDVRLHGSDLGGLRGVEHIRGATIDADQMLGFAMALLAANRVAVDDEREPQRS